ncbi:MAG: putative metal-dependent hydrolase [Winogradskyella sp.]|nr:putative metal-dependent hydrolase [Winogradskyella sp.]
MDSMEKLRFPIGDYKKPSKITAQDISKWIADIASFPTKLAKEVNHLTEDQLNTRYRPEGWTIKQVIHHCADSHINSVVRFKLTLTENKPVIKPYFEDRWAELKDVEHAPIDASIKLLEGLHQRWSILLKHLTETELKKTFVHPEHGREFSIEENIGVYAWHCNHHLAHITSLKKRKGWD